MSTCVRSSAIRAAVCRARCSWASSPASGVPFSLATPFSLAVSEFCRDGARPGKASAARRRSVRERNRSQTVSSSRERRRCSSVSCLGEEGGTEVNNNNNNNNNNNPVKTVRSLLSLMVSQRMSSSSGDKDMAFTLSSRLNTLEGKYTTIRQQQQQQARSLSRRMLRSHVGLQEKVQQHPLRAHLGEVQRLVQPVPERYELWDLLKRPVLIRLDDVL
ncbi:hypothetical protein EYF80_059546 [Liparis tanakae]|uniref:Uncharacterized protein n=1 Tax=Liparis tanakae TaxID=230148 RepID=A0A4Z2EPQ6_9TELE|nr:hypothetical protein EYF80_059546 [Liparis tanakae]